MTLLLAAGLGGCSSTVVRDHYVATPPTSPGGSPGMTRVRMATQGPDWSLGCMTQCGQMQTTLCSLAGQQAVQALQAREAGAQDQTLRAQCVSRELDVLLLDPAARRGASEEALRLEAVNAICLGLGAPGPFATLAEARAFLDRAAARERAQP